MSACILAHTFSHKQSKDVWNAQCDQLNDVGCLPVESTKKNHLISP